MRMGLPCAEQPTGAGPHVVVADVGAAGSRFGLSGLVAPAEELFHAPVSLGTQPGAAAQEADSCALRRPFSYSESDGLELDADAFEACLRSGLARLAGPAAAALADAPCPPLLLAEPTQASAAMRQSIADVLFGRLQAPRAFLAKRAALSAYAYGQTTAAVLDVGASHSCAAAVLNGYVAPGRVRDCAAGGDLLERALYLQLQGMAVEEPLGTPPGTPVPLRPATARALQRAACQLAPPTAAEAGTAAGGAPAAVLLPDGTRVDLRDRGPLLTEAPEAVFFAPVPLGGGLLAPQLLRVRRPLGGEGAAPEAYRGLHAMLSECAALGDESGGAPVPRSFGRSVVLTGGCSRLSGFAERLQLELGRCRGRLQRARLDSRPPEARKGGVVVEAAAAGEVEVAAARSVGHSSWTGGAILASLGAFEDFWVARAEYEESGAKAVDQKCP
mmetsp:Transcript_76351/g.210796  ORF Transcript_76351/g.210796 Transcript_76351/m.210796 type:complete len:444 (-) Transcript_76351:175-1506(-)